MNTDDLYELTVNLLNHLGIELNRKELITFKEELENLYSDRFNARKINVADIFYMTKEAYLSSISDNKKLREDLEKEFLKKLIYSDIIYKIETNLTLEDLLKTYPIMRN